MAKFRGKYKILIPRGYNFLKLFGRNHRTYKKSFGVNDSLWIFQKGNDIEIMDFFAKSGWLVKLFVKNREIIPNTLFSGCLWAVMDTETGECFRQDVPCKEGLKIKLLEKEAYESDDPEAVRDHFKKYKNVHIKLEMIEEILKLYDDGLITLEEEEFPDN